MFHYCQQIEEALKTLKQLATDEGDYFELHIFVDWRTKSLYCSALVEALYIVQRCMPHSDISRRNIFDICDF